MRKPIDLPAELVSITRDPASLGVAHEGKAKQGEIYYCNHRTNLDNYL